MNPLKKIISIALAAVMAACVISGCGEKKSEPKVEGCTEYVTPEDFSTTDEVREKTTITGTGKNSLLSPSVSLYGKNYTMGKSTVEDMLKDGWKKPEDNWVKIPPEKVMPAHSVNIIAKNLYQGEGEDKRSLFISFRNITGEPRKVDKCALSKIDLEGKYDSLLGEAKVTMFDGKLDLAKCVDVKSFETQLKELVSKAQLKVEGYFYSTYYKYSFKVKNGSAYIVVRTDSATGEVRNINASVTLNAKYME